jgi:hypothetical protein
MSNAPQGPGWWQASDGNWYPPEQRPSSAAPPPPSPASPSGPPGFYPAGQATETPATPVAPQSWSPPPPAAPQYPVPAGYPAPGGQTFGSAQSAFAGAIAKVPPTGWLLFGGFVVAAISFFLPWISASYGPISKSASPWEFDGGVSGLFFLILAAGAALSLMIFTRPQSQRPILIGLTVVVGVLAIHLIYNWVTYNSQLSQVKGDDPDLSGVNFSPGFGLFVYTAAIAFLAVRVVMLWTGRSKAQPRAF